MLPLWKQFHIFLHVKYIQPSRFKYCLACLLFYCPFDLWLNKPKKSRGYFIFSKTWFKIPFQNSNPSSPIISALISDNRPFHFMLLLVIIKAQLAKQLKIITQCSCAPFQVSENSLLPHLLQQQHQIRNRSQSM